MADVQLSNGYTRIADDLFESLIGARLDGSHLAVAFAIVRISGQFALFPIRKPNSPEKAPRKKGQRARPLPMVRSPLRQPNEMLPCRTSR